MNVMNAKPLARAHTRPHQPDGLPLECALCAARYLAKQADLSRIALWVGHSQDMKTVLGTAISHEVLEPLLLEQSVAFNEFRLELWANQQPIDAIILAVCLDYDELNQLLRLDVAPATIFVPLSEDHLQEYIKEIPTSSLISWSEDTPESAHTSERTEAMRRRVAWYNERYQVVKYDVLGGGRGHKYLSHDGTGRCRYCGKSSPEVLFRSKSHALPEQIGNKTLIDPFECDTCNRHFGNMLDDDFAKWTQPWRTVLRLSGSSGIPSTKSRDQKIRIEGADATTLKLFMHAGDERHQVDPDRRRLGIVVDRPTYTPVGVFKCMVKMALSVMPEPLLSECDHLKRWLLEASHRPESRPYCPLNLLLQIMPGPTPNTLISYALLRRNRDASRVPYMMFVLQFANLLLQIALPMIEQDIGILDGQEFELLPFPHLGGLKKIDSEFGKSTFLILDMSGVERVKGESETMSFRYAERIEISEP